ncbi:hypothetical protein HMPREF9078_00716 [Capnocytophaga sp. oral taxon 380 str. F0488]|nr:hypothetical protein HMPREF9078_00716 [Capnocytophaga sp. oral taxon 380 str. F0488]
MKENFSLNLKFFTMKKIFKFSFLMVCLSIAFISCSKDKNQDPLQDLQNKSMTYKEFFETVSEKSVDFVPNEKVLLVSYKLNKDDNTITFLSSIIAESSWGVGFDVAGKYEEQQASRSDKETYTVSCTGAKGGDWTKGCNGDYSCGKLLYDCAEAGGCGTVCKTYMVYVPDVKAFYISANIDELVSSKVEGL